MNRCSFLIKEGEMQFFFHKGHLLHNIHKNDNKNERQLKFKLKFILSPMGERNF